MALRITESEFHHVIALLHSMLVEAGLGAWEIDPWLTKAKARLTQDHRIGSGAYFVEYRGDTPIGMAGAQLRDYHAFLSFKTGRYGCVIDEYVLPSYRGQGIEHRLRVEATAWLRQATDIVLDAAAPNIARLAASSGGGKL